MKIVRILNVQLWIQLRQRSRLIYETCTLGKAAALFTQISTVPKALLVSSNGLITSQRGRVTSYRPDIVYWRV